VKGQRLYRSVALKVGLFRQGQVMAGSRGGC